MKNWLTVIITLIASYSVLPVQAAGDPVAGKEKAAQCASCHGADGNSLNPEWPKLAGQHADYLVKQLQYFEAGERENVTMKPMASVLDAQGREDVSAFYAMQKVSAGQADPALVGPENVASQGNVGMSAAAFRKTVLWLLVLAGLVMLSSVMRSWL